MHSNEHLRKLPEDFTEQLPEAIIGSRQQPQTSVIGVPLQNRPISCEHGEERAYSSEHIVSGLSARGILWGRAVTTE